MTSVSAGLWPMMPSEENADDSNSRASDASSIEAIDGPPGFSTASLQAGSTDATAPRPLSDIVAIRSPPPVHPHPSGVHGLCLLRELTAGPGKNVEGNHLVRRGRHRRAPT